MLRLDVSACQALVVSQRWLEKVTEDALADIAASLRRIADHLTGKETP